MCLCVYVVSSCCLSLYLNIAGLRQGPGKTLLGSWKVLEFFVTNRVGTLGFVQSTSQAVIKTLVFKRFPCLSFVSLHVAYIYVRGEFYNEASNLQIAIREVPRSVLDATRR